MLTQWIIRRIPDYENVKDERVRSAYGKAASLVGIGCNVLLFAGKLFAGLLSGSVAIMADHPEAGRRPAGHRRLCLCEQR